MYVVCVLYVEFVDTYKKYKTKHNFKLKLGVFVISHLYNIINVGYKNPEFLKFKYVIHFIRPQNVTESSSLLEFSLLNEIQSGDFIAEILGKITFFHYTIE